MIRRRQFISLLGGAAAVWPAIARAQQESVRRVGVLMSTAENESDTQARLAGFREGLEALGWLQGRNVHIDTHFAGGKEDQYQELAKELIASQPHVILAQAPPIVAALQRESRVIPIVFVSVSDPIGP